MARIPHNLVGIPLLPSAEKAGKVRPFLAIRVLRAMTSAGSSSFPPTAGLAAVVDEHLRWLTRWQRAAFFTAETGLQAAGEVPIPRAFLDWVLAVKRSELTDQPAVDRLVTLHEQVHRLARLILLRSLEGEPPTLAAYDGFIARFDEFMIQLRRFERAFSMAGSGIDLLTGLRNRTGLSEELGREINRFRRTGNPFCIAICDLDRFKSVNDTYGHESGDRVLVAAAGVVDRGIRSFDEAFRLGGEEILILLKDTGVSEGLQVVERLRQDLAETPVQLADGRIIRVTASFGLAESRADLAVDGLMEEADRALYAAKHQGRNRVVLAGMG
jgi:diguanylate cyclase